MSPHGALHLYKTVYYTQISFSMPSTSLPAHDIKALTSRIIASLLRKMKLPSTFPRALVFSSHSRLALDVPDLEFAQGYSKVEKTLAHIRMKTTIGTLLRITIEWFQITAGVESPILESTDPLDYVHCPWIQALRSFLRITGTTLVIPSSWRPQPQRERDGCIMDKLKDRPYLNLAYVNAVRLHLQVLYLSDIVSHDGRHIVQVQTQDQWEETGRRTKLQWPIQPSPGKEAWKEWRGALTLLQDKRGKLREPLGKWHVQLDSEWRYHTSTNNTAITQHHEDKTTTTYKMTGGSVNKIYTKDSTTTQHARKGSPVPACTKENEVYVRGEITPPARAERLQDRTSTENWDTYFLRNKVCYRRENELHAQLEGEGETVYLVTDGGCSGTAGYYGWIIASTSHPLYGGTGRLDSDSSQLQSLRPESIAYLACTSFLLDYIGKHNTKIRARVQHHVDNMTLVRRMLSYNQQARPSQSEMLKPDIDVQLEIQANMDRMYTRHHTTIQTHHVKAHQDDRKRGPLTWEETLNVMADDIAETSSNKKKPPQCQLPSQTIALWDGKHQITTMHKKTLLIKWVERGTHSHRAYMKRKYKWSNQYDTVDWECLPKNKMGTGFRVFVASYCHQWLPLHEALHERKTIGTPKCPMCGTQDETHLHFLTCQHYHGNETRELMKRLENIMKKNKVDPILQHLALRGIKSSLAGKKQIDVTDIPEGYHALIHQQQALGWDHLLHARWAIRWSDWQRQHAETHDHAQSEPRKWIQQMITAQWEHAHQRWTQRARKLEGKQESLPGPELQDRVRALYLKKDQLPGRYQFLFRRTVEQMLEREVRRIREWLQDTERLVHRAIQQMQRRRRKRTGLEKWLRWERRKKQRRKATRGK